ncbi:HNH endonuclease signature motif containing protein [Variovorax sp. OAS795]|uniref:HNH endonuclease n=1 Tax=Variovorax sp. OAS795 TaxID=3034231 RepID=UPI0033942715
MSPARTTAAEQVDHILSLAEGGKDDESNLQSLCIPCHEAKTKAESARARSRGGRSPGGG